jgi:hypothetical protein
MKLPENLPAMFVRHLPVGLLDLLGTLPEPARETDDEMIATVTEWVDVIADKLAVEAGRRPLRDVIKACIKDGTLPTLQAIKAAERYREVDIALREFIAEELDKLEGMMPELSTLALRSFQQQALLRDITDDPKGPNPANYYHRDLGICVLMAFTMLRWPYLRKSQNRASKRTSASYIVCEALNKHKIVTIENPKRIVQIYDNLHLIAERLSGLIP